MAINYGKFEIRTDTFENWRKNNPRLKNAELVGDSTYKRLKMGNGRTLYNNLPYLYHDLYDMVEVLIRLLCTIENVSGSTILESVDTLFTLESTYPNPKKGDIVYITTLKEFYYYNGTKWVQAIYNRITEPDIVNTYEDLAIKYPSPKTGLLVLVKNDNHYYFYNNDSWIRIKNTNDECDAVVKISDLSTACPNPRMGQIVYIIGETCHYYWNGSKWDKVCKQI